MYHLQGMMTPQAWEEQSRYNKLRADNELAVSVKLRESMLLTIDQTYNDGTFECNRTVIIIIIL